jgi:hypothetical protein
MNLQPPWLVRLVAAYSNETDGLVAEHELPTVDLADLQRLWDQPADEPMLDLFEVTEVQRRFVEAALGHALDLARNSYFLEARCSDPEAMRRAGGFMGRYAPP